MTNLGMRRLRRAAFEFEPTNSCGNCGSQDVNRSAAIPEYGVERGDWHCGACGGFDSEVDQRNHLQEALDIHDGKTKRIAAREHIDALVSHCEELHLKLAEMEETLAAERGRMAAMRNEEPQYA